MPTPEATLLGGEHTTVSITLSADAASGEVIQLGDLRAAIVTGLNATQGLKSGDKAQVITRGPIRLKKALATDLSSTNAIYWDESGNLAIAGPGATGDFLAGRKIGGGTTSDTYVDVDLNAPAGTETA
ncbi:MAG: capsid cement protein [Phycisphaeraceae bacterium]